MNMNFELDYTKGGDKMLIMDSYEAVYQSPGESLPVLGTMGLSHEDLKKLWDFLDETDRFVINNPNTNMMPFMPI